MSCCGPSGTRRVGSTKLDQALVWNVRTLLAMPREKAQAATTARPKVPMRWRRDGLPRSSDEGSVMELERRGWVIVVELGQLATGGALTSTEGGSLRTMARAG